MVAGPVLSSFSMRFQCDLSSFSRHFQETRAIFSKCSHLFIVCTTIVLAVESSVLKGRIFIFYHQNLLFYIKTDLHKIVAHIVAPCYSVIKRCLATQIRTCFNRRIASFSSIIRPALMLSLEEWQIHSINRINKC